MADPTFTFLGLVIPDAGPVFLASLAVHVLAALAAVISGVLAALAPKGPGRHPRAGLAYLASLGVVFATATVLAATRLREDAHLFVIGVAATSMGGVGLPRVVAATASTALNLTNPQRPRQM